MKTITVITPKSNTLDGSIGNSIFMWAQAYYLNYKCNFEYKIILDHGTWSELNLIEFPYTELGNIDTSLDHHIVNVDLMKEVLIDGNIDNFIVHDHLVIKRWYIFSGYIIKDDNQQDFDFVWNSADPLSFIRFKSNHLEEFFKKEFSDFIGIHIRRYHGVIITPKQVQTLPEEIQDDFYLQYLRNSSIYYKAWDEEHYLHPFISDEQFYEIIDTALSFNKDQKFYISTDIPKNYYRYYFEKYNNVYDKYSYLQKFEDLIEKYHDGNILNFTGDVSGIKYYYRKKIHLVLGNLLDIFALSNSKLLIRSHASSWGLVAQKMRNSTSIVLPLSDKYNPPATKRSSFYQIIKSLYQ